MKTSLLDRLGVRHPIIQAPMAGGGDTPALIAAVSNAGGLGCYGAAYSTPEQMRATGAAIRALTDSPFGVNLFAPQPPASASSEQIAVATARLASFYKEAGITPPAITPRREGLLDEQLDAALSIGAKVFSFTFGKMTAEQMERIHKAGLVAVGTATTVEEAVELQASGIDAVIAQSAEAGGHRGTFRHSFDAGMIGGMALVPQIVDAVSVPVIASGGIMDGRGVVAALALGAEAVQMGTAFLTCTEAGISPAYKEAILRAHEEDIVTTRAFSGRPARGIRNRFMTEMGASDAPVLPFPLQNMLTRPLRTAAAAKGDAEMLSLWAGQGVRMARPQSARELMDRLRKEMNATLQTLHTKLQ